MAEYDFKNAQGTSSSYEAPADWYMDYLSELTNVGRGLATQDMPVYGEQRIADWTQDQQDAFAAMRDAQGMWKPYVDPALDAMTAGQGGLNRMAGMTEEAYQTALQGQGDYTRARQLADQAAGAQGAQGNYNPAMSGFNQAMGQQGMIGDYGAATNLTNRAAAAQGAQGQYGGINNQYNQLYNTQGLVGDYAPSTNMLNQAGMAQGAQGQYDPAKGMTTQAGTYQDPLYESTFYGNYDPVIQQMQQSARNIGQEQFQDTTLKALNDNFMGSGQFGSGRHQLLGADAAAMAQADIENKVAEIGLQGRQMGMQDYLGWAQQQGAMGGQLGDLEARRAADALGISSLRSQVGAQLGTVAGMSASDIARKFGLQGDVLQQQGALESQRAQEAFNIAGLQGQMGSQLGQLSSAAAADAARRAQTLTGTATAMGTTEAQRASDAFSIAQLQGNMGDLWGRLASMESADTRATAGQAAQMGAQMGNYAQQQSAMGSNLMNFGLGTQAAAMGDANALMGIGAQDQSMQQNNMNMAYDDWLKQKDYGWEQLDRWGSVLAGKNVPNYKSSSSSESSSSTGANFSTAITPYGATTSTNPTLAGLNTFGSAMGAFSSFK